MYCARCGTKHKNDALLCSKCGKDISDEAEISFGNNVRVNSIQKKPSNWWFLLPIFIGLIGGIIGYFALKNKNKTMAKNMLIVGLVMGLMGLGVSSLLELTHSSMVAVESGSMLPNIHIGDIIFIESFDRTEIITHETGSQTDYTSFDKYGNVILYNKLGQKGGTPIIHRAMYYVEEGEPMWNMGPSAPHAGYITKGDNNRGFDQQGDISFMQPIKKEWVIGVARFGRLPVVGYVSLILRKILSI